MLCAAVYILEKGGELALLAEALVTHGIALARLGRKEQSQLAFSRSIDLAEESGDREGAGRAALSFIEEAKWLGKKDLIGLYERADTLLSESIHVDTLQRLRKSARRLISPYRQEDLSESRETFIHATAEMGAALTMAQTIAGTHSPVLITGETGVGKEVLAKLLHIWSGRTGPFIAINCAALNDNLIESQLFGHRKGSFTGADKDYLGAVRTADGGTLFLDEVGELHGSNQAKLLRLIESQEIATIGATVMEKVNVRIVSATNRNLREIATNPASSGDFRLDLYYRLSAFEIELPPLRQRPADIPVLARHFIEDMENRYGKRVEFTEESLEAMRSLPLPGNARELRSFIERTILTAKAGETITAEQVETVVLRQRAELNFHDPWKNCHLTEEVARFEKGLIEHALRASGGLLTKAADMLTVSYQALDYIITARHTDLLPLRNAKRRRSIMRKREEKKRSKKVV